MLLKEVPQALVDTFNRKGLVLFAGAGISVGSGLPTGRRLAWQLQMELFKNKFVDTRPSTDDPLQLELVAQRYQTAFGRQALNELLIETFQKDGLLPNDAHKLAVELFPHIITTNFDRLLEDSLRQEGKNPIIVVRDSQLPNTALPGRTVIYKIHGDINNPDRVVITQRDYLRVPLTPGIKAELRSILLKQNILFVGYSIADSDFLRQVEFCRETLDGQLLKSYAVVLNAEKDPLFVKQCDEDGIDVIGDVAIDFLQDLKAALIKSQASQEPKPAPVEMVSSSETNVEYRTNVCEEFKWIDFKGIPVLGGHLRVPIDQLFVLLSATPCEPSELEPRAPSRLHSPTSRLSPRHQATLFQGQSQRGTSIFAILKDHPKLVILGDPGSGKTTLLRYVGYHLSLPNPQPSKIGLDKAYLPVHVPLREYAAFIRANPDKSLEHFLPELLRAHHLEKYAGLVRGAVKDGQAILLFDGLDEVASQEERSLVAGQVADFSVSHKDCRLILTSRRIGYTKAPLKDSFTHCIVDPLTDEGIQTFINLWCRATDTDKERGNLIEAVNSPRVRALAENPLLITILARVYKAYRNLPERRAGLYAKCVEALLTTWDLTRDVSPVFQDVREANRIMGPVALWIHHDRGGRFVTREELLAKLTSLGDLPGRQQPSILLTQIEERSGLIREVGLDQFAFTHLTFQEYYVAREIVSSGNPFNCVRRFLRNDRWLEVITLAAGLLDDVGKTPVTDFLQHLVVKPSFPVKPTVLEVSKLNLLIACLKDKIEPEAVIGQYVHKSLLTLVDSRIGRWFHSLQQLRDFAKTDVGLALVGDLKQRVTEQPSKDFVENAVQVGNWVLKEELERAKFMTFVLTEAKAVVSGLGMAAYFVSRSLEELDDSSASKEVRDELASLPIARRVACLEALAELQPPGDVFGLTAETLTNPEERSALPERLRALYGSSRVIRQNQPARASRAKSTQTRGA